MPNVYITKDLCEALKTLQSRPEESMNKHKIMVNINKIIKIVLYFKNCKNMDRKFAAYVY